MGSKNSQQRVLHVITSLESGGAQSMLYKILKTMDRDRFDQRVVSLRGKNTYSEKLRDIGITVDTLDMRQGRPSVGGVIKLRACVKEFSPDLIQGWMYHGNLAAEISRFLMSVKFKTIWNVRHSIYSLKEEKLLSRIVVRIGARLSSRPEKIIYNSHVSAGQHRMLGYRADREVILANGFDTNMFRYSTHNRERIRGALGIADNVFLVGMIARYHPVKDHNNFIDSARLISGQCSNMRFAFAGTGTDESQQDLVSSIERAGLRDKCLLLGERDDIDELMSALDVVALSSCGEGFPNVLGEAMSCERMCVATDVGDVSIVLDGVGSVVPPRNPKAFADALRSAYSLDQGNRRTRELRGRQKIIDQYSLARISWEYEDLYSNVLGGKTVSDNADEGR